VHRVVAHELLRDEHGEFLSGEELFRLLSGETGAIGGRVHRHGGWDTGDRVLYHSRRLPKTSEQI
jgi:hypothetical protein